MPQQKHAGWYKPTPYPPNEAQHSAARLRVWYRLAALVLVDDLGLLVDQLC